MPPSFVECALVLRFFFPKITMAAFGRRGWEPLLPGTQNEAFIIV
jgi:hypothetical protein